MPYAETGEFPGPAIMTSHKTTISLNLEYQETLATLRHYSNFRLAAFTLFFTATAGLVTLVFQNAMVSNSAFLGTMFSFFGAVLAMAFSYIEWLNAKYLNILALHLEQNYESHYTRLGSTQRRHASIIFMLIYGVIAFAWVAIAGYLNARQCG
ncbi:hypothetical protein GCM10027040_25350 [Halomonas shantousis]